jgi:hypothetical protein
MASRRMNMGNHQVLTDDVLAGLNSVKKHIEKTGNKCSYATAIRIVASTKKLKKFGIVINETTRKWEVE